jgi:nucleotide-binding universal stress UspA family protein
MEPGQVHDTSPAFLCAASARALRNEPQGDDAMPRHVLVASDLTDLALPALKAAVAAAAEPGARLTVLHVVEPLREARPWVTTLAPPDVELFERLMEQEADACKTLLVKQLESVGGSGRTPPAEVVVARGPAAETIVSQADTRGADLLVVGTHGRRGLKHMLLGSVAERVVRMAGCSVLVAR